MNLKKMTDAELIAEYERCLSTDFMGAGLAAGELDSRGYKEVTIEGVDKMVKTDKTDKTDKKAKKAA